MSEQLPSREAVEAALVRPWHRLGMGADLEARFDRATVHARTTRLRHFLGFALCADILAIALDAWHGALPFGLAIRLGVVAPTLLVGLLLLSPRRPCWQQGLLAGVPVLSGLVSIALIGLLLGGRYAELYLSAAGMAAFFVNAAMPLRFVHTAVLAVANIVATVSLAVMLCVPQDLAEILATLGFNSVVIVLTLPMNFNRERGIRDVYLHGMRETLQGKALAEANAELLRLSTTDHLTGLINRRAFHARLGQASETAPGESRDRNWFGVLMVDVDHFKAFNDSAGHGAGDECLRAVAGTLAAEPLVSEGTVGRLGGEEFAVLVPGADGDAILKAGEAIRRAVEERAIPHPGFGGSRPVTVSIGASAAQANGDAATGTRTLKRADDALYVAKASGRNTVAFAADLSEAVPIAVAAAA
ncbi:GGDEF domain-containing protein [Methylobacterium sp. E-045]|uniref:GGDEF domain-containing protein n=1 Tax=Methylobacterium sp. E-045 TaxID=2836575 RepID=UPI001FB91C0D|nr:GGDEF domain-containing protein [Methylobacterium sp. E-045]MCJ2128607.1 GGDEF domain-containing protein [Methylobacterium sp. E-045]